MCPLLLPLLPWLPYCSINKWNLLLFLFQEWLAILNPFPIPPILCIQTLKTNFYFFLDCPSTHTPISTPRKWYNQACPWLIWWTQFHNGKRSQLSQLLAYPTMKWVLCYQTIQVFPTSFILPFRLLRISADRPAWVKKGDVSPGQAKPTILCCHGC